MLHQPNIHSINRNNFSAHIQTSIQSDQSLSSFSIQKVPSKSQQSNNLIANGDARFRSNIFSVPLKPTNDFHKRSFTFRISGSENQGNSPLRDSVHKLLSRSARIIVRFIVPVGDIVFVIHVYRYANNSRCTQYPAIDITSRTNAAAYHRFDLTLSPRVFCLITSGLRWLVLGVIARSYYIARATSLLL